MFGKKLAMKKYLAFVALACTASFAAASPLDLFVQSSFNGTNYDYAFTLKLTNTDDSWTAGNGWGWIVFGEQTEYPLFDSFVGTPGSIVGGPWTDFDFTDGLHHGPSLSSVIDVWTPTAVGETVRWSGTADIDVPDEFLWSSLYTVGDAAAIEWQPILNGSDSGHLDPVPEPATVAGIGVGLIGLLRRRRSRA